MHQQDVSLTGEEGNTSGNSAPGTPAAEEPRELISSAPSNLLVTFLEYCSIVMQVRGHPLMTSRGEGSPFCGTMSEVLNKIGIESVSKIQ